MVRSGLEEPLTNDVMPGVSQYRLTAHLGTAVVLTAIADWRFAHDHGA